MHSVESIAEEIVRREGGYVNDPADPGGATNFGVTIHTMRRLGLDLNGDGRIDERDVRALTREQAIEIYIRHYYTAPKIGLLPEPLRPSVFDMQVNAGANGVRILQRLLAKFGIAGVKDDGVIGPVTARATNEALAAARRRQGRLDHPRRGVHAGPFPLHPCPARCARWEVGMIGKLIGLGTAARHVGEAVGGVAEVFVGNRAERDAASHERYVRALAQYGEEFTHPGSGWFDGFVNGLNRLPRPMMAIGTLGLFCYSMVEPRGFSERMQGLGHVPEPLWWLLGAIVSFYFGARELHHYRCRSMDLTVSPPPPRPALPVEPPATPPATPPVSPAVSPPSLPAPEAPGLPAPRVADEGVQLEAQPTPPALAPPAKPARLPVRVEPAAPVAVNATDPHFNAALEEWRRAA